MLKTPGSSPDKDQQCRIGRNKVSSDFVCIEHVLCTDLSPKNPNVLCELKALLFKVCVLTLASGQLASFSRVMY